MKTSNLESRRKEEEGNLFNFIVKLLNQKNFKKETQQLIKQKIYYNLIVNIKKNQQLIH